MEESINQSNLTLELDEQQTLWNYVSCGKFSFPCSFLSILRKRNVRYPLYVVFVFFLEIIRKLIYSNGLLITCIFDTLEIISLISLIFECNMLIFKQSLMSFNVYYKTINMLIAMIADKINCNWYKLYFDNNSHNVDMSAVYFAGILSIIKYVLAIGFISILDGYDSDKRLKILIIIVFLSSVCVNYWFVGIIFVSYRRDVISYLFGNPLHWRTINASCISNATVFLLTQLYKSIRRPSKLIFIPTLIQFEETERQTQINKIINISTKDEFERDNDKDTERDKDINKRNALTQIILPYRLHIHQKDTLYYLICNCNCVCTNNCDINQETVVKYLFSKKMFFCIGIYFVAHFISWILTDYTTNAYLQLILNCFDIVAGLICFLSFNYQIFKFYFGTITYMWKLFDTLIMYICIEIIDYENKLYYWSSKYTLLQSILIAILTCIGYMLVVMVVSSIQALTVAINSKWKAIVVSNTLIIMAIMYMGFTWMFYFTHQNQEHTLLSWSLNTLIIEKGIDLSIFFLSQLYTNIKYGSKGILLTGYVNKKWKQISYKQYQAYVPRRDSNATVELISQNHD